MKLDASLINAFLGNPSGWLSRDLAAPVAAFALDPTSERSLARLAMAPQMVMTPSERWRSRGIIRRVTHRGAFDCRFLDAAWTRDYGYWRGFGQSSRRAISVAPVSAVLIVRLAF